MTRIQKRNLARLIVYVHNLPKNYRHFKMRAFCNVPIGCSGMLELPPAELTPRIMNECGTSACLAGHGPAAGIKARRLESWEDYTERVFGVPKCSILFYWLFGPHHSNNRKDACARVAWTLQGGATPVWNSRGTDRVLRPPKTFKVDWELIEGIATV